MLTPMRWSRSCRQLDPAIRDHVAHLSGARLCPEAGGAISEVSDQRLHSHASVEGGKLVFTRRIFLGKLDADVVSDGEPPVLRNVSIRRFRGDQAAKGSGAPVETMAVEVGEVRMTPEAPFQEAKQAVDLSKADIIVAVGRGIKSKDNLALAEKLAEALGGDLAASRPICDAEWLPIDRQIGSSGQTVAPKLYIAIGISGAIQHLVGMKNSGPSSRSTKIRKLRSSTSPTTASSAICLKPCRC